MTASAATELRGDLISAIKAAVSVQATAMGAQPRVHSNFAPPENDPGAALPFLVITSTERPWDDTDSRGEEHDLELHLIGEYEGRAQGEAIFWAIQQVLRDRAPRTFSAHRLSNLEFRFKDVRADEDGRRYFGLMRWRAVTEEI